MIKHTAAEPAAPSREATRQQQWWQAIHDRLAQGESLSAIARALPRDRQTVRRDARMAAPPSPSTTGRRRRPQQDRWQAMLEAAWAAGHQTVAALYEAVRAQGYPGGRSTVYRWLVEHHGVRRRRGAASAGPPADPPLRPRQWATWRLQRWTTLPRAATRRLSQRLEDPVVRQIWTLVHPLGVLVRHRRERALAGWLRRAEASGIPEWVRFAQGLQRDEAAVRAAIQGPWSQGRTEGFNYRIKRTIRVTYGRASFPLLRARVLAPREA
ncbi:MAG: transposase [Firmicutes bacterium]|nr:transposase [Bacillota bacterium]